MSSHVDYFLKKTLGEDFMESLSKVELWKHGTKSTLDHEEIRTALQIVPRTIMALLIRELLPMSIGETKEVMLFVGSGEPKMRITKHERDVYSGEIEQDNKKVSEFKLRSLPGVGLVIMTAFELYDMENLINSSMLPVETSNIVSTTPKPISSVNDDIYAKVQALIDERLALHDMVGQVVDKKIAHKDAVHNLLLIKLTEELQKEKEKNRKIAEIRKIQEETTPQSDEYFRGMTNGIEVANTIANDKEPKFIGVPKKSRPLKEFLEKREKKKEYTIEMAKGETADCPDCGKNIFDGKLFSGCICLGDDMERKVFIKKSEDGIKVRFSKGWDQDNIEMLLETLRKKHG